MRLPRASRLGFWVGEFLLFGLELEGGALAGEGFTEAAAGAVAPVGVELALLFEHGGRVSLGGV